MTSGVPSREPIDAERAAERGIVPIWEYKHPAWARKALDPWCALVQESGVAALPTSARNLLRHTKGIINRCRHPIPTGRLEGINSKIEVTKRQAYGFGDDACFILEIKGGFPGTLQPNPR